VKENFEVKDREQKLEGVALRKGRKIWKVARKMKIKGRRKKQKRNNE